MTAEEFYKYDQEEISWTKCSTKDAKKVEYVGGYADDTIYSKYELIAFAEAYLKYEVEAISDEEIRNKIMEDPNLSSFYGSSFRIVNWFKNKLLKQ